MIESVIELGSNIGINLDSLKAIYPDHQTFGIEINKKAIIYYPKIMILI